MESLKINPMSESAQGNREPYGKNVKQRQNLIDRFLINHILGLYIGLIINFFGRWGDSLLLIQKIPVEPTLVTEGLAKQKIENVNKSYMYIISKPVLLILQTNWTSPILRISVAPSKSVFSSKLYSIDLPK